MGLIPVSAAVVTCHLSKLGENYISLWLHKKLFTLVPHRLKYQIPQLVCTKKATSYLITLLT